MRGPAEQEWDRYLLWHESLERSAMDGLRLPDKELWPMVKGLWERHGRRHLFVMGAVSEHARVGAVCHLLVLLCTPCPEKRKLGSRTTLDAFHLGESAREWGMRPTHCPDAARLPGWARWRGRESDLFWPAEF